MTTQETNKNNKPTPTNVITWGNEFKRPRARSIIREFGLNTSTHGLPGIARSETLPNRIFWIISSVMFTGIMIYFVIESFIDFLKYPTQTLVSIEQNFNQIYPAVSICNYSPFRYDLLMSDLLNFTASRNVSYTGTFTYRHAQYVREFIRYKLNKNESISSYFYTLDDMFIGCTYNRKECSKSDFVSFTSSFFGNCYSFNAKNSTNQNSLHAMSENGDWGNLLLELYVHSHQYVPYFSSAAGIIIQVHSNDHYSRIHSSGQYLKPGSRYKFLFRKKEHYLLGPPYSECTTDVSDNLRIALDRIGNGSYAYEQFICSDICTQKYIHKRCGCVDPFQWAYRHFSDNQTGQPVTASLCDLTSTCFTEANKELMIDEQIWEQECSECLPECVAYDFLARVSALHAPLYWDYDSIKSTVESFSVPKPPNWSTQWSSYISQNYMSIEILSETERVERYNETASMGPVDLLSNVGGQSGLWIGISFLTVMEFLEMLYRLIRYHYHRIRRVHTLNPTNRT